MVWLFSAENGIIKSETVESAMKAVDRKNFCHYNPYQDSPQSIGQQQCFWNHVYVINASGITSTHKILDFHIY